MALRQCNNSDPTFADEEMLTTHVFELIKKRTTVSEIQEYAEDHFSGWFPDLPSYQNYYRRISRLKAFLSRWSKRLLR